MAKVKSVLVVSGHPRLDGDSVANAAIAGKARAQAVRVAALVEGM